MIAIVFGVSKAPPTACSDRKIIREMRLVENIQPKDAIRKNTTPHK
jgi:hypothetical protein